MGDVEITFLCSSNAKFNLYSFSDSMNVKITFFWPHFKLSGKRRPAGQIDGWTLSRLCQRFGQRREMPSCQNENVYLRKQKKKLKKYFFVFDATVSDGAV